MVVQNKGIGVCFVKGKRRMVYSTTKQNGCEHHQDTPWIRLTHNNDTQVLDSNRQRAATSGSTTSPPTLNFPSMSQISQLPPPGGFHCKVHVLFDRPFYVVGQEIYGRLEVDSLEADGIELMAANMAAAVTRSQTEGIGLGLVDGCFWLGEICVEINGEEETYKGMQTREKKRFFHRQIILQDHKHPTDAVLRSKPPEKDGYWQAKKGRTVFEFRIPLLPLDSATRNNLPSSVRTRAGAVRYTVSGIVYYRDNEHYGSISHHRHVTVYERWSRDEVINMRSRVTTSEARKKVFLGGDGDLSLQARMERGVVTAGSLIYARVWIRNHTKKRVQGVKIALWRRAVAVEAKKEGSADKKLQNLVDNSCKNMAEKSYKGMDWRWEAGEERETLITLPIPIECLSLRNTSILKVVHLVQVSAIMNFSKDLCVEIPVYISHPSSWNDLPPPTEGSIMQDAIEIEQQNLADLENRELSGALQLISGKRWSETKQLCSVCSNKKPNKTQDLSIWTAVPRRRASSSPSVSKSEPPVFNLPIQLATVTNEIELQGSGTVKHEVKVLGAATNLRIANPDPPSQIMASVMEEDEEIKVEEQVNIEEEGEMEDSQVTTTYGKRDRLKMRFSRIGNILRVGGNKKDVKKKNSASTSAAAAAGTDTNKSIASSSFSFSKTKTVGSNITTVSAITQLEATVLTSSETSDISESENPPTGYEDESASEQLVTASEADQDELEGTMEYSTFIGPVTHELWEQAEDDFIIS